MTPRQYIITHILIAKVDEIIQQQVFLDANIASADTARIWCVVPVRTDQEAALVVIETVELLCQFSGAVDAKLRQLASRREDSLSYCFPQYSTLLLIS